MKSAEIKIETMPKEMNENDNRGCFENDVDILIFSGELTPTIDKILLNFIFEKPSGNKNLCLILSTPGGDADSAYLIARKLNRLYEKFSIIVNGYCKSAGTLLALGANELIVTDGAEFGPLDVQLFSPDEFLKRSSGLTITQAVRWVHDQVFDAFEDFFLQLRSRSSGNITTKTAGDIASEIVSNLYSKITDKIDPVTIGEMQRAIDIAIQYGQRLGVPKELINHLVQGYPSHSFVIDYEEAILLFPNCRLIDNNECLILLELQRILYAEYGDDLTQIPFEEGFLARVLIEEDRKDIDQNEDTQNSSDEIQKEHEGDVEGEESGTTNCDLQN